MIAATVWMVPYIGDRYFEKGTLAGLILSFLLYFSVYLFMQIGDNTYHYKHSELKDLKKYEIYTDEKLNLKTDSMVILASNSRYYFLYDVVSKRTFIVPERFVTRLESLDNKNKR